MTRRVAENSAAGTAVGAAVVATDADGDTLTYSLTGSSAFAVNATSGQVAVAAGASIDYETKTSYSVTVSVSDGKDIDGNDETTSCY